MTRDELEAILATKEREAGQKGQRRPHFHPCVERCGIAEACEDRFCPFPPDDRRLVCSVGLLGVIQQIVGLPPCRHCGQRRPMGEQHLCPHAFAAAEGRRMKGDTG